MRNLRALSLMAIAAATTFNAFGEAAQLNNMSRGKFPVSRGPSGAAKAKRAAKKRRNQARA